jgi:hypothetical protein
LIPFLDAGEAVHAVIVLALVGREKTIVLDDVFVVSDRLDDPTKFLTPLDRDRDNGISGAVVAFHG